MISHLSGTIIELSEKFAVVDIHGVGYKVYCSTETIGGLAVGEPTSLFTYLVVREDALDLYGFLDHSELEFFEMLISVSGIGPKGALAILGVTSIETLRQAIGTGDTSYLTKISGIGKKTAEKIVIELRDKMGTELKGSSLQGELDSMEALKSLGYSQNEAREALKGIPYHFDTNAKIKEALKILGGNKK